MMVTVRTASTTKIQSTTVVRWMVIKTLCSNNLILIRLKYWVWVSKRKIPWKVNLWDYRPSRIFFSDSIPERSSIIEPLHCRSLISTPKGSHFLTFFRSLKFLLNNSNSVDIELGWYLGDVTVNFISILKRWVPRLSPIIGERDKE